MHCCPNQGGAAAAEDSAFPTACETKFFDNGRCGRLSDQYSQYAGALLRCESSLMRKDDGLPGRTWLVLRSLSCSWYDEQSSVSLQCCRYGARIVQTSPPEGQVGKTNEQKTSEAHRYSNTIVSLAISRDVTTIRTQLLYLLIGLGANATFKFRYFRSRRCH